jgi:hypothetical protein
MSGADLDLSGLWTGAFSYSGSMTTVAFDTSLEAAQGALGGVVQELTHVRRPPRRVTASLQGRRDARFVSWIKSYDEPQLPGYEEPVAYEGELSGDGVEIRGVWRLPGAHGTFLMIRARCLEAERELDEAASLDPPH